MAYPPDSLDVRPEFAIKDSGERQSFGSGMVRDTTEGKTNFLSVRFGPMLRRWADHLTKGREKYPDAAPGTPNWTLASGIEEYLRAKESAARHFEQWVRGDRDEDHASAVFFNINVAEYVLENLPGINPGLGATVTERTATKTLRDWPTGTTPETKSSVCRDFPGVYFCAKTNEQDASLSLERVIDNRTGEVYKGDTGGEDTNARARRRSRCSSCECPHAHCHTGVVSA